MLIIKNVWKKIFVSYYRRSSFNLPYCRSNSFIRPVLLIDVHSLPQVSKISLVDLAGSERADSTGAKGTRLKVRVSSAEWKRISSQMADIIRMYLHEYA